ncbi:MAG: uncharacterized protein JWO95_937 [Verrucomicrobiales bacterium]|nr:uncharacterized protein [Verrucomicrobiales bacterium]
MQNYLIGPLLNGAAIIIAVAIALTTNKNIPARYQGNLRVILGACIVWFGLKLTWSSLSGSFGFWLKQLATVLLAMALGKIIGRLLRLQKLSNSIGRFANKKLESAVAGRSSEKQRLRFEDGFLMATALFCAGPLAILASVQSGVEGFAPIFIVKAVMDALAAMAFASAFGWSVAVSAIPVIAFQLAIIRVAQQLIPWASNHPQPILESILATDGLLIFSVALIILQLKKVEIADYLPSLALAPLLTWLFNR